MTPTRHSSLSYQFIAFFIGAILLAGFYLRASLIGTYMPNMDEMQFFIISHGNNLAEVWRRSLAETHPPLVWVIRHALFTLSDSIELQRWASVIASMLSLWGAFRLGCAVQSVYAGLFTMLCFCFAPLSISFAMSLRNYAFFQLFLVWSLVYFVHWNQHYRLKDLVFFSLFLTLACASHFSGFLVAAACGISAGLPLLRQKNWRGMVHICLAYVPMALLAVIFYATFMRAGQTLPLWNHFIAVETAGEPKDSSFMGALILPLLAYFSPFLETLRDIGQTSPEAAWLPLAQRAVLLTGLAVALIHLYGLYKIVILPPAVGRATFLLWLIAVIASLTSVYPFSGTRHNSYLLPFAALPVWFALEPVFLRLIRLPYFRSGAFILLALGTATANYSRFHDTELALTYSAFQRGQNHLTRHLQPHDVLVTGWVGAYYPLLYSKDHGNTPYDRYADVPYIDDSLILAPFGSPYKPYPDWHAFQDNLKARYEDGTITLSSRLWFAQYGWKNEEITTLLQCEAFQPLIHNYLTEDGVAIFSADADEFSNFLNNGMVWQQCYAHYKPNIIATRLSREDAPQPRLK